MKIRKELFCSILNRLKGQYEFENKLNKEIREYRERTCTNEFPIGEAFSGLFSEDNSEMLIELLDEIYSSDMVSYWCWELEYGKRYKDGCITETDGTIIDISTPEKLYKYLEEENN